MAMKTLDATTEVFVTAIKALPTRQRTGLLRRLLSSPELREDVLDVARWLERRSEPSLPYEQVRARLKAAGRL